jgi:hypothetical protein
VYLSDLKKEHYIEATQNVTAIYKADRLRTTARSATEIYNNLLYIIEEGGKEEDVRQILKKKKTPCHLWVRDRKRTG